MRSFVDLGLFLAAVALGIGTVLPMVGGVRSTEIPLSGLRDGFPGGDPTSLAVSDVSLYESLAVPLMAASTLLLIAALFDSVVTGWAGTILASAVCMTAAVRIFQSHGDYLAENHSTALTNQNGFVLMASGTLVGLVCCLVSLRRPSRQPARG